MTSVPVFYKIPQSAVISLWLQQKKRSAFIKSNQDITYPVVRQASNPFIVWRLNWVKEETMFCLFLKSTKEVFSQKVAV